jgi:effector-binding domain-containing protein
MASGGNTTQQLSTPIQNVPMKTDSTVSINDDFNDKIVQDVLRELEKETGQNNSDAAATTATTIASSNRGGDSINNPYIPNSTTQDSAQKGKREIDEKKEMINMQAAKVVSIIVIISILMNIYFIQMIKSYLPENILEVVSKNETVTLGLALFAVLYILNYYFDCI